MHGGVTVLLGFPFTLQISWKKWCLKSHAADSQLTLTWCIVETTLQIQIIYYEAFRHSKLSHPLVT